MLKLLPAAPVSSRAGRLGPPAQAGTWVQREAMIMGCAIRVRLWCGQRRLGESAAAAVLGEMHRIDRAFSPRHATSGLSRINREAGLRAVPLTDEMLGVIEQGLHYARLSHGAFDLVAPPHGPHAAKHCPAPGAGASALARGPLGGHALRLDPVARTLRFEHPGLQLDLREFVQGHAVDRGMAVLNGLGIELAVLSAGGLSRVLGGGPGLQPDPPARRALNRHPQWPDAALGLRSAAGEAMATRSSPSAAQQVIVTASNGLACAALAQAVSALGPQRGLALIDRLPGVTAVVLDARGLLLASSALQAAKAPTRALEAQAA